MSMYILKNKVPIAETDVVKWGNWMRLEENCRVALDDIGAQTISTVFLGINYLSNADYPTLFETMSFNDPHNRDNTYFNRYSTWDQAMTGHLRAVELATEKAKEK